MNLQRARERLGNKFANVVDLSTGVLRSVRRHGETAVAAYVFDLNDRLPETAAHLTTYLDDVLGRTYFDESAPSDLRWNHYLFFVVGKDAGANDDFESAKRKVEADRSYARKYVIYEDEFDRVLNDIDSVAVADSEAATGDVMQVWATKLEAAGLESVLDTGRTVADIVRVASSTTPKQTVRKLKSSGADAGRLLVSSAVASVDLASFREYPKRKEFDRLGRANLIVGANGVGKTSLLEGIEFLFCGANRRSTINGACKVAATLVSGADVSTSSSQALSDFKTRQRIWYGTSDTSRRNTLPNQFARFNFLNTDAAAELALRGEDEDAGAKGNADSLADLLSGHEATLIWRRIEAVYRAVEEERRTRDSERSIAVAERRAKETELKSLTAAPKQSDAAFEVLAKDLARIGWRKPVSVKAQVSSQLVDDLSELASRLGVIRQVDWGEQAVTAGWLGHQAEMLGAAQEELRQTRRQMQANERKRQTLQTRLSAETSRRNELASIDRGAAASLLQQVRALRLVEAELTASASARAVLPNDGLLNIDVEWADLSVAAAVSALSARLATSRFEVATLQRSLTEVTANQTRLQDVLTQLRALARQSLTHLHSDEACPVCGTGFKAGELVARMESLAAGQSESQAIDIKRRLDVSLANQKALSESTVQLEHLAQFVDATQRIATTTTVAEALQASRAFMERQESLTTQQRTLRQAIESYQRSGLSAARLRQLCGLDSSAPQEPDELPDVALTLMRTNEIIQSLQQELAGLDAGISEQRSSIAQQLARAGIDDTVPLGAAVELIQSRRSLTSLLSEACSAVAEFATIASSTDIRAWHGSLESALLSAKSVLASVQSEASKADRKKALEQQIEQLSGRLTRLAKVLDRLVKAFNALRDIFENDSLEKATKAAVEATHRVADMDTFADRVSRDHRRKGAVGPSRWRPASVAQSS